MTLWQILRAQRAARPGLGYRVHHEPGALVHYSTAPAAPAGPDSSFCLSRERSTMQQLNRRLASYLQQVRCLEEANQKLERQIQEELDRKCPTELKQLDGHLRTASLLQDQISECLSAQARVKLQLLSAELTIFDYNVRSEKEREHRGRVEAELSDLKLLGEGLQVHTLPELQNQLSDQRQQLTELQIQHQQDMQGVLAQASGGVAVEVQSVGSSDLIQQLDELRQTSVTLLDKNQNDCWFNTQVSMLSSPQVTFDPPAVSEAVQAELQELRRTAVSLEDELTHLKALNMALEASGQEQNESFVQQLAVLQQTADGLCADLDSVLQAAARQAEDHQTLLDVKSRLESEIQDYCGLLDGLSPQGVPSLHSNSAANVTSFCAPASPSAFRRNITVNKPVSVHGENLRMMGVQTGSRGHTPSVRQTPVVSPLSETKTTVQSFRVASKPPKNSPVRSINASNVKGSFQKSETQGTLPERTERESMTISRTVGDKVLNKDMQMSSTGSSQICLDEGAVAEASKPEINTAQRITSLVPERQSSRGAAVQEKTEPKQTTTEAGLQTTKTMTNIQTEITKTLVCVEPEVKQGSQFVTKTTTTDSRKETAAEVKKETETKLQPQKDCTEDSVQAKSQEPTQVVSLSLDTPAEVAVTASVIPGSHIFRPEEAQGEVSGKGEVVKASKPKINTAQGITTLVPDTQPARTAAVRAKPETYTSKQITTEAGLQANTNIQTEIAKTLVCTEPEVKQGPQFVTKTTTTDPSRGTAAEVKKETETGISAQMDNTKVSIQNKNQEPAQVVSLSLDTPAGAIRDTGEVTTSVIPESLILQPEEAQDEVSGEGEIVKASKPEIKTSQGITTLVPDTQPARTAAVQAKPETYTSKQATIEAGLQANGTVIQTEVTKTLVCAEPEVKPGPQLITKTTTTDPSKETAAEVKKETEIEISAQMDDTEVSIQNKNQEPAQAVSLSLDTPAKAVRDVGEVAVTASVIPESHILRPEEAQGEVSGEGEVVKASKPEINTAQRITTLVPDTQPSRSPAVQAKPETYTSKQATTEAGLQADKTDTIIQTDVTKTLVCTEPEVKPGPQLITKTATTDPSKETAAEVKKETEIEISDQMDNTKASIQNKNQEPAQVVSLSLDTPAGAVRDAGEVAVTSVIPESLILQPEEAQDEVSGEGEVVKPSKPEINTAQRITTLVLDTQPARTAAVQAKAETYISKQTATEAGLQATKTETVIQTEITKTIVCTEPEVKPGPQLITKTTTTDPSNETAAEVKKETEIEISDQMDDTEVSIQNKNQESAQVVSLSLDTPAGAVRDAGEVAVTSVIPESHILRPEEAQGEVSGESAQMDDKDIERQEKNGEADVEDILSNASNSEQNKVMDDATSGSCIATDPAGSPDSNDNVESKTLSTEILKKVESEINKEKVVNGFDDIKEGKVDATKSDNETVNLVGQEELLSTTKSQKSVSLTDSGVALSPSDHEEILSASEACVFVSPSPTKPLTCLSPETCLSPVEPEVLMSMDDKVFCPVDPAEHVRSPDFLLSPSDPEMFLSPDTCLSPAEAKGCLSPNCEEEEDEDVGLNLTEANAHVRPVEKYILSTKEEGQSLSFSRDQALPEEDRDRNVNISARDGDGDEGRPNSQEIGPQMGSSPGGLEFGGSKGRSIIADKEEQLGFGGLYRKSVRDMRSPRDRYKDTSGSADKKGVQNLGGSPGGRYSSEDQKDTSSMNNVVRGEKNMVPTKPGNHERVFVKSASFGSVPANGGTTSLGANAESAPPPELQGRFKRGSGDWVYYGSSPVRTSTTLPTTGSEESPSGVAPSTSRPETGRFGSKGTGEWVVYGGSPGRRSSLDGGTGLPSERKEEGTQKTGRLGSRGDGEGIVYGGSLGRKRTLPRTGSEERPSRVTLRATSPADTGRFGSRGNGQHVFYSSNIKRSDSIPIPGSRENQSMHLPTSPPGSGRFGNSGSGEWRVYGGSTGRMSSAAGSENLLGMDQEENMLAALQLATSPPGALRSQRFGSGDSGEWRVYGGTSGRLSRAAGIENLPGADNEENRLVARQLAMSPPLRSQRFGSGDSGEWRVYGGSTGRLSRAAARGSNQENMSVARQLAMSPPLRSQRFGSGDSGEWRVYGGSSGGLSSAGNADKVAVSGSLGRVISPPSSYTGSGQRLSSGVVRRSSSVGSGGRLSTGSGEWKPVYSSASGRKSTAGRSGGGGATTSQRAPSPGGRMSVGSGGWLSGPTANVSSSGSGSKLSGAGGSDRMSGRPGGRVGASSGSGRTNSTGGRVISSSDRPIRSTGSGAGGNKERISVCKMAALSMSAAGRERSQDKQRKPEPQAAGTSPLVQRWLTSGDLASTDPDGLDDIMRL